MWGNLTNHEGSLFNQFQQLQQEMDSLFGARSEPVSIRAVARGSYPPINVGSTPDKVDVFVFAAGLDPESLDISIQKNLLTIAGERNIEPLEGGSYHLRERSSGGFRRMLSLPDDVDPERVEARYRNGVLHITVQKREAAQPRQIKVK